MDRSHLHSNCCTPKARILSTLLFLGFFMVPLSYADEPQREKGISLHALPKRVADLSGQPWGLQVSYASYLKP